MCRENKFFKISFDQPLKYIHKTAVAYFIMQRPREHVMKGTQPVYVASDFLRKLENYVQQIKSHQAV